MTEKITEINNIVVKHGYEVSNSILEIMRVLRCGNICSSLNFSKQVKRDNVGFTISETFSMMTMLPLFLLKSVDAIYRSHYKNVARMKKDTIYRLQNNEKMPWRTLLIGIGKSFSQKINSKNIVAENSAFILDDTNLPKTGRKIEGVSRVYDHVVHRGVIGFKLLVLGFFDGTSMITTNFSIHSEKKLKKKERKQQYSKSRNKLNPGFERKSELKMKKTKSALLMLKHSVKHGIYAKYVLFDSWFFGEEFVTEILKIGKRKNREMNVVCGVKNGNMKYDFNGKTYTAKQLKEYLEKDQSEKRCKKWHNCRYFEITVNYKSLQGIKLYLCRYPYQKKWRVFMSTNKTLKFLEMMKIYSIRWSIEVMFRECKQHLQLGQCQSNDFDAQVAAITRTFVLHIFLSYYKRKKNYETLGGLFFAISEDLKEKNIAEKLWDLFQELLLTVISTIENNGKIQLSQFINSEEYKHVKNIFESSFLSQQIFKLENVT